MTDTTIQTATEPPAIAAARRALAAILDADPSESPDRDGETRVSAPPAARRPCPADLVAAETGEQC